jgi:hypothetical protein
MRFHFTLSGLFWLAMTLLLQGQEVEPNVGVARKNAQSELSFSLETTAAHRGFDGETCWVHARAGAIPAGQLGNPSSGPLVVMTLQRLLLSGSDVFYGISETRSADLGQSWSPIEGHDSFARQTYRPGSSAPTTGAAAASYLLSDGDETTVCDFTPQWHVASQRLLGLGQTVWYRENKVMKIRPRGLAYAAYEGQGKGWAAWKTVDFPAEKKFQCVGSGSVQRVDLPGGDILIPVYFKEPAQEQYSVTVCRCRFDGHTLEYITHGDELTIDGQRGLYEPSLTRFQGRFFLTLRNDLKGYVSTSDDGLHFSEPEPWMFDDGTDLGNYNTQQHWVTHSEGLYLVYTRRGANNDHVFRHRAPLFIARVDPEKLQVIRSTEQVLVPERGARLGNFGVVDVSADETWVTVTEWMQPKGVEQHGSDNSVFVAKLKWNNPNALFGSNGSSQPGVSASKNTSEHSLKQVQPYFSPPPSWQGDYGTHRSPLEFADGSRATTAEDWARRRTEIIDQWQGYLGKWPPLITKPNVEILATKQRGTITQYHVRFAWTPTESTTGYLLIPEGEGPFPAVVTVYYEPETAIGEGAENRDFAWQLAQRGFVALSIGTTEATAAKTYALYYPDLDSAQIQPLSMLAYAAANAWHVLANQPQVDRKRIGIVGHSFGGKWAMFSACLFEKFACAAWSDPGIVFDEERPSVNYWEPWYLGYHPPPWRARGLMTDENPARGLYPQLVANGRDLHELHALMAPRPFLVSGGSEDPMHRWRALNHSIQVNHVLGMTDRVAMTNRPDHSPNADSNEVIYAFFEYFLSAKR